MFKASVHGQVKNTPNVIFSLFAIRFKNSTLNQEQNGHQLSSV